MRVLAIRLDVVQPSASDIDVELKPEGMDVFAWEVCDGELTRQLICISISFMMIELPVVSLDSSAPAALYHQIVVALRFRIATGRIGRGDRLPPLREAAEAWDVSYHTVRRAYEELEEMGLVERRQGAGTTVVSSLRFAPEGNAQISAFLERVAIEAKREFGLSEDEVAGLLKDRCSRPEATRADVVCTVVECNAHQCADLARQIRERFGEPVRERVLHETDDLPSGPIVGTYFHLAEMLERWPERRSEMYFPALRPDEALRRQITEVFGSGGAHSVPLCERDETLAEAMADDIEHLIDAFEIVPTVCDSEAELLDVVRNRPALVAPRLWGDLPDQIRSRPNLLEVRYVFRRHDLNVLASTLNWTQLEPADV